MTGLTPLFPRQKVPGLRLALTSGAQFDISTEQAAHFTLLVFYRGLHCPICKGQLKELEAKLPEFEKRGVSVVAISSDTRDRAERAKSDWALSALRVAYGLDLNIARSWGLYVSSGKGSSSTGVDEPPLFTEPAIYLVRPDATLYFGSVQTMPFARPHLSDILPAIDFVTTKNYPARGEVLDLDRPAA